MTKYHLGDHVTIRGTVTRVWDDPHVSGRVNVSIELDATHGATQVVSFSCCETAVPAESVTPMSKEEMESCDAMDKVSQDAEKALAIKEGRQPRLLPTWRERAASY